MAVQEHISKHESRNLTVREDLQYEADAESEMTPFGVFRSLTSIHLRTAFKLARYIASEARDNESMDILDVGTGDGVFTRMMVDNLLVQFQNEIPTINFTWLEQNDDHVRRLEQYSKELPPQFDATVSHGKLEHAKIQQDFDVILLSHVIYYFEEEQMDLMLEKLLDRLKPGGVLMIVARDKDWDYEFIEKFYLRATGKSFSERTIHDAIASIDRISEKNAGVYRMQMHSASEFMPFPFGAGPAGEKLARSLIKFYLGKDWDELSPDLQEEIPQWIQSPPRYGNLLQSDGILLVHRRQERDRKSAVVFEHTD